MSNLPTGTVTFLFTDIEGSTQLAQQYPDAMPSLLARHHAILNEAIVAHNGHVFQIIGDAFCAAFATAHDALAAALAAQRVLGRMQDEDGGLNEDASSVIPHPSSLIVRVRMGIHTGEAQAGASEERAGGYVGYLTLTRVQRVMSAGHGGQVLISSASAELIRSDLPAGVTLRDTGEHRLKGLLNPEHLWQVVAPDLQQDFPPLQSLNAIPNNLPIQVTSFVGREKEIAEVKHLLIGRDEALAESASEKPQYARAKASPLRLLTLTGSGGTGKTRLSLQVAADVLDAFKDGVWFVELAPLTDPALVPNNVASMLGVREEPGRPLMATLLDWLRNKQLLFILDNCEHLIEACAKFADALLHASRETRILASSREALGIAGETAYRVPSLQLPTPKSQLPIPELMQYEAVRLFIERATAAATRFTLTEQNAQAVAQICQRLDGIPLAIELTAARVKALSVEQIAARLDDRFRLLIGGRRTALPRQQTLRSTIDWSHSLLTEPECVLLRRLSVFAGGWTLKAAEAVGATATGVLYQLTGSYDVAILYAIALLVVASILSFALPAESRQAAAIPATA